MTLAGNLDLQLTAFWRHLCGHALPRQSRAPSEPEGRCGAVSAAQADALVKLRRRGDVWHLRIFFRFPSSAQHVILTLIPQLR